MSIPTEHRRPIVDAAFSETDVVRMTNRARGSTLIAILDVDSFVGGLVPALALRLFFLNRRGFRIPSTKVSAGSGLINAPGQQILIYGPDGANSTFGDDKNSGALPRMFEIEVKPTGDQTSADIKLDVILA